MPRRLTNTVLIGGFKLIALLAIAIGIPVCNVSAQFPYSQLRSVSRPCITAGTEIELSAAGSRMDEVTELRFSHAGITATVMEGSKLPFAESTTPKYGSFRVRVSKEVPPGRYDVRAVGRFGISNPRTLFVHNLPTQFVSASHEIGSPTDMEVGQLHQTQATAATADYYKVHVGKGTPVTIRLIAQDIDSKMMAAVSAINAKGHVVNTVVGADQLDREITLPADTDQDYIIKVHDVLYRGGSDFPYALAATTAEHHWQVSSFQPTCSVSWVSNSEFQGVEEQTEPVSLTVPAYIESAFDSATDVDQYLCVLSKAQPVRIEIASNRLNQPSDPRLIVHQEIKNADGTIRWQQVAIGEDSHNLTDRLISFRNLDPDLIFTPPADGIYRLTITDLDSGESLGNVQSYKLSVVPADQRVKLIAFAGFPHKDQNAIVPFGWQLIRGGTVSVRVMALRSHWSGPITVSIESLPTGVTCPPVTMAANQNQVQLNLSATKDAPPSLTDLQIVGRIKLGDEEKIHNASLATYQWEKDAQRAAVRTRLTQTLPLKVTDQDTSPIVVSREKNDPVATKKGEKPKLVFKVKRGEGGKQPIVFRAQNLPPGVTGADVTLAADKDTVEYIITVTPNAKPGTYSMWLQGETKVKFASNPQALTRDQQYLDLLKKLRADPAKSDQHGELDKAIEAANKRVEETKKKVAPADVTIYAATPTIDIKIE